MTENTVPKDWTPCHMCKTEYHYRLSDAGKERYPLSDYCEVCPVTKLAELEEKYELVEKKVFQDMHNVCITQAIREGRVEPVPGEQACSHEFKHQPDIAKKGEARLYGMYICAKCGVQQFTTVGTEK